MVDSQRGSLVDSTKCSETFLIIVLDDLCVTPWNIPKKLGKFTGYKDLVLLLFRYLPIDLVLMFTLLKSY